MTDGVQIIWTPWRDQIELLDVRDWLFPNDTNEKEISTKLRRRACLLDSQQDSKFKVSMYAKAQQIGLPAVFVDIRHEATHGDMPSLASLRSAAQRAMQWLWDDYWKGLPEVTTRAQRPEAVGKEMMAQEPFDTAGLGQNAIGDGSAEQAMMHGASLVAGGWEKWQGRWDPKPIGTI
ncbi:ribosomal biogenesis protein LAS1, partial [Lecanoromycetidae sp. Uapishka_2]